MTLITLSEKSCKCGEKISTRKIDIKSFRQDMFKIDEKTLQIWNGGSSKKCWKCKKSPVVGETWGLSNNNGERNRLFCPDCAKFIAERLET